MSGRGPASPRPAATLIVVRDSSWGHGIEVLALERSSRSRFAPGFVVFPGGLVEPSDGTRAARWFGDPVHLHRAAALRELHEESGLVMRMDGRVGAPGRGTGIGGTQMDPDARFDPADLPEVGHWIAPDVLPVRFDARFFAARAAPDSEPLPDGVESSRAHWADPGAVLIDHERGRTPLMWPTFRMLEALSGCRSVHDALSLRVEQVAPPGLEVRSEANGNRASGDREAGTPPGNVEPAPWPHPEGARPRVWPRTGGLGRPAPR